METNKDAGIKSSDWILEAHFGSAFWEIPSEHIPHIVNAMREYLEQFTSQLPLDIQIAGRWVKAKDRNPTEGDLYFVKIRLTDTPMAEWFPGTCNWYGDWQTSKDYIVDEWLDESFTIDSLRLAESKRCPELSKERDYYKKLAEAAEKVIEGFRTTNMRTPIHLQEYLSLKSNPPIESIKS